MTIIKRVMKAETFTVSDRQKVIFPMMCSPKLDGIRCAVVDGVPLTQSMKPVPNGYVREVLAGQLCNHLDGELCAIDVNGKVLEYNDTQSAIMSHGGAPLFRYIVFDSFDVPDARFSVRTSWADYAVQRAKMHGMPVEYLTHTVVNTFEALAEYYEQQIALGYEGIIMRALGGPYKQGRSTLRQGWMLKWKPWEDAEGIIEGFEEAMENTNENVGNAWGAAKRSSAKDGLIPKGTLGALILRTEKWGEVHVGGGDGLTHALRKDIWDNRGKYLGLKVTFKYMAYGMKDKPRFPKFKGFRYD